MSWIKCDSNVKAKCPFKIKCCGDKEGEYLEGSECDKFAQTVLAAPPTNADRIRAMSDEELAEQLVLNIDGLAPTRIYLSAVTGIGYISRKFAVDATKKALQQPYKEDA